MTVQFATQSTARPVDLELRVTTPWGGGGRRMSFVLHSPSGAVDFHQKTVAGKELQDPEGFQRKLLDQLDRLQEGRDVDGNVIVGAEVVQELTTIGNDLYQMLFRGEMRRIFRDVKNRVRTVLVTSDEPWVPWEILHPFEDEDDDFFCMRFEMSRWLTGESSLANRVMIRRLACVEIGEVEGLSNVAAEIQVLKDLLASAPGVDGIFEERAATRDVIRLLEKDRFDLVHFLGHGEFDAGRPAESGLSFGDRPFRARQIPPSAEKKLRRQRPAVVLNTCQGGRLSRSLTDLEGWAYRWIDRCGCSIFLAPVLSVADDRAFRFAQVFYEELREGRTLGQAVLLARHKLREEDPNDIAWLAYSLYGHPNAEVLFGDHSPVIRCEPRVREPGPPAQAVSGEPARRRTPPRARRVTRSVPRNGIGRQLLGATLAVLVLSFGWLLYDKLSDPQIGNTIDPPASVPSQGNDESPAEEMEAVEPVRTEAEPSTLAPRPVAPPPSASKVTRPPLQPIVQGRIGIVVVDKVTRQPSPEVAAAVDAMLAANVADVFPVILEMDPAEFKDLSGGDFSLFPGGDHSPWGAERLLLATASIKPTEGERRGLESVVLTMTAQLIDARTKSEKARSSGTHTGQGGTSESALSQAAKHCLRDIVNYLSEE